MSLALAVVEQVLEQPHPPECGPVRCVRLEVGELAGVAPEALRFSFELARAGTPLEDAELRIEAVPGRARCAPCDRYWPTGMPPDLRCPGCDDSAAELLTGRELRITGVDRAGRHPVPARPTEEP